MTGIVIAPFSNSTIRDWPTGHFAALIGLLLETDETSDLPIRIVGTAGQRLRANAIVRNRPADRVANDCGRLAWPEVIAALRSAACVIGNNSGIAHLAGYYRAPTVCIFGGSHQRLEWRPLGFDVVVLSRSIGCSPCHLDHGGGCPYGLACLRKIEPEEVVTAVVSVLRAGSHARPDSGKHPPVSLERSGIIA